MVALSLLALAMLDERLPRYIVKALPNNLLSGCDSRDYCLIRISFTLQLYLLCLFLVLLNGPAIEVPRKHTRSAQVMM